MKKMPKIDHRRYYIHLVDPFRLQTPHYMGKSNDFKYAKKRAKKLSAKWGNTCFVRVVDSEDLRLPNPVIAVYRNGGLVEKG